MKQYTKKPRESRHVYKQLQYMLHLFISSATGQLEPSSSAGGDAALSAVDAAGQAADASLRNVSHSICSMPQFIMTTAEVVSKVKTVVMEQHIAADALVLHTACLLTWRLLPCCCCCHQVVCMTLYKPNKLQLWWQDSRSRTLLSAFLFTDSTAATQVLYLANCHLEGSPYKPQVCLAL